MEAAKVPHVVAKLGSDGAWHVLLLVHPQAPIWDAEHETLLDPDQAESLARQLIEHSALVRDKLGLPGGAPYPSGA